MSKVSPNGSRGIRQARCRHLPCREQDSVCAWLAERGAERCSSQLAMKFADANAFGFQCGARNRITLIDIDSNDASIVNEAINLVGESPILWRTGSGNYAMPFRYNGEARRIRPVAGLPIDVLGGGYAVAPPSMGSKQSYEFLHRRSRSPPERPLCRQFDWKSRLADLLPSRVSATQSYSVTSSGRPSTWMPMMTSWTWRGRSTTTNVSPL